jgi:hypothetical protein
MIRLSRMRTNIRGGAYLVAALLVAVGCAQNGIGNDGQGGGTGQGGGQAGAGGASTGSGGNGGSDACPLTEPVPGTPCTGSPHCPYGTTLCCGVAMTDTFAECTSGLWVLESNDTTCRLGLACPDAAPSFGQGGAAGLPGIGGAGGAAGMGCPATPTPEGFSCHPGDPLVGCTYGSATCCGVTYPTFQLTCQPLDSVVHQSVENPCQAGYACPTAGHGGGGAGGVGGLRGDGGIGGDTRDGVTTCPATPPPPSSSYAVRCAADLNCTYGTRSCCGGSLSTFDQAFVCSAGGYFSSEVVDCPACPDAATSSPHDAGAAGAEGAGGAGGAALAVRARIRPPAP